LQTKLFEGAI